MINVDSFEILNSLPSTPEEGEQALVADEKKLYVRQDGEWVPATTQGSVSVSLYELNKTAVRGLPMLSDEQIIKKKDEVRQFINKNKKFFMLLCREMNYYTLFKKTGSEKKPFLYDEVFECVMDIGSIHSIVINEDSVEFWIKNAEDVFMFIFFPYDEGVIVCQ